MQPWAQFAANITGADGGAGGDIYKNYALGKVGADRTPAAAVPAESQVKAKNDEIAQANAKQQADYEAQKQQDAQDGSKAQMKLLPDNKGYAFYNGAGQQIGINDFSLLTNKTPAQLLQNSPNPKDQKFVQDYNTLQALSNAWVNGDTQTLDKMRAADPQKFNSIISTYKSPSDMVQGFVQHWSDYYSPGGNNNKQAGKTTSFGPQQLNSPSKQQQQSLGAGSLDQVLTPQPKAPSKGSFWDEINPFSAKHQAMSQYKKQVKQNPWFSYNNSLYGS